MEGVVEAKGRDRGTEGGRDGTGGHTRVDDGQTPEPILKTKHKLHPAVPTRPVPISKSFRLLLISQHTTHTHAHVFTTHHKQDNRKGGRQGGNIHRRVLQHRKPCQLQHPISLDMVWCGSDLKGGGRGGGAYKTRALAAGTRQQTKSRRAHVFFVLTLFTHR